MVAALAVLAVGLREGRLVAAVHGEGASKEGWLVEWSAQQRLLVLAIT